MKTMTRRDFIKLIGTLTAASVVKVDLLAKVIESEKRFTPGTIEYFKSTCKMCVNFCGIKVKTENGVLRAIYPNEDKRPYFNWGNCTKGISGIWNTYNPYRLKKPLKRTNPKKGPNEDPRWVEIEWEEALNEVANRIRTIRADDPRKIIWYHGHGKYLLDDEWMKAFTAAIGTPNMVHRTTVCEAAKHVADEITWGGHEPLPDLEYCNYLINLGGNYAEADQWARWLDHATLDAMERGMKLVVVEPRMSNLAALANEWVPIRPGKDVLFLLALARVLIDEGFVDKEFLLTYTNAPYLIKDDGTVATHNGKSMYDSKSPGQPLVYDTSDGKIKPYDEATSPALEYSGVDNTFGNGNVKTAFKAFKDYLKSENISPETVADECGVPSEQILKIAREFGRNAQIGSTIKIEGKTLRYRPVALYTFRGLAAKEYGAQNWRAGLIVMMLVGALDAVGGFLLHKPGNVKKYMVPSSCKFPPPRIDLKKSAFLPHATHDVAQQALFTILDPQKYGIDYEPEMQIFFGTNRPFSTSNSLLQFEGLKKTYNVVIDIAMNETAWFADIVFPDRTYLEAYGYYGGRWVPHARHHTLTYPIVNAYNIPYQNLDIMFELARRAGFLTGSGGFLDQINKKFKFKKQKFDINRTNYKAKEAIGILWLNKTGQSLEEGKKEGFGGAKFVSVDERYLHGIEAKFKGTGKPKMHFYCDELIETRRKLTNLKEFKQKIRPVFAEWYEVSEGEVENLLKIQLSPFPRKEHAYPVPHKKANEYPFYLVTFKRIYRTQSGFCNINPMLNQVAHDSDRNSLWINPKTARKLGIKDGDRVLIQSRINSVEGVAKLTECVRPDTIAVSYHYGHWSGGYPDWAKKGTPVNNVLEYHPDLVSGMNSFNDTKVKVLKSRR